MKPEGANTDIVEVSPNGKISFGTGNAPFDAFLYRTATGKLRIDSDLEVQGNVTASGLVGSSVLAAGQGSVPTLVLNGTATVTVTVKPSFKDTAYQAVAQVIGGTSVLGALSVQSVTAMSVNTVNVVVKNTGLATLSGASVLVTAIHD